MNEELIALIEEYLNERGLWNDFEEYANDRGYDLSDLGFTPDI